VRRLVATLGAVMILSISLAMGSAQARAPTPTPTPWPYPTPWPTSTPRPPADQLASFGGAAWVDARMSGGPVGAKIGDQICGEEATVVSPPCDPACTILSYGIDVVSDQLKPGCGYEGATIAFFVEGRQASQTATWYAGSHQFLPLIAGPPFARKWGGFAGTPDLPILHYPYSEESSVLIPYIDGVACGYNDYLWCDGEGGCRYSAVIYSEQQRAGCGYEGAPIMFKLVDGQGNVMATAAERGAWHAFDGTDQTAEELDLTLVTPSGIRIGSVGTGDSRESGGMRAGVVALGLAIAGVAMFVAGATLRARRASL